MFSTKNNKKKYIMIAAVSITVLFVIAAIINLNGGFNKILMKTKKDDKLAQVDAIKKTAVIPNYYTVELHYNYKKCGHTIIVTKHLPLGKDYTDKYFEKNYTGSQVLELNKDKAILNIDVYQYCPNHFILMYRDGYIGIFKSATDKKDLVLYKKLKLSIDSITGKLQDNIKEGIAFNSLEDIEKFLEDYET